MSFCNHCGSNIQSAKFCNQCGKPAVIVTEMAVASQVQSVPAIQWKSVSQWKWKRILPVMALIAASISFYAAGSASSNPQQVIENFEQAVHDNNADLMLEQLTLPEQITDRSLLTEGVAKAIIADIQRNGMLEMYKADFLGASTDEQVNSGKTEASLPLDRMREAKLSFVKDGMTWLFFDNYKILVSPAYANIHVPATVKLEMKEAGIQIEPLAEDSTEKQKNYRIGPLMPGQHTVIAKVTSALFGDLTADASFEVKLHERPDVPIRLTTKQVEIRVDSNETKLFYKEKPIPVQYKESWGGYRVELADVPTLPITFTYKVSTPFGEITNEQTLGENDRVLECHTNLANAPEFKQTVGNLLRDYNKAWVIYAQSKRNLDGLKPYLAPHSQALNQFTQEIAYPASTVFAGKLTNLAIDYQSAKLEDATHLTVPVIETYDDQWKNVATGEISANGTKDVFWRYTLELTNGSWKIASNNTLFSWGLNREQFESVPLDNETTPAASPAQPSTSNHNQEKQLYQVDPSLRKLKIDQHFLKAAEKGKLQGIVFGLTDDIKKIEKWWGKGHVEYDEGTNGHFYGDIEFRETGEDANKIFDMRVAQELPLNKAQLIKLFGSPKDSAINDMTGKYEITYPAGKYDVNFIFSDEKSTVSQVRLGPAE